MSVVVTRESAGVGRVDHHKQLGGGVRQCDGQVYMVQRSGQVGRKRHLGITVSVW